MTRGGDCVKKCFCITCKAMVKSVLLHMPR